MNNQLKLEIVTPDKIVLVTDADYIGLRGVEGAFGVMPHHIPLLAALDIGLLYYRTAGHTEHVIICGGFVEVFENHVSVLAESAELVKSIDKDRALAAKSRAEERLADKQNAVDAVRAELALQRSILRLQGSVI